MHTIGEMKKKVSAVKDQGQCGSCWAFSTIANLEGAVAIRDKTSVTATFSEQQLVSCDTNDEGCNGGLMENAFQWLSDNDGSDSDKDYPYKSGTGSSGTCKKGFTAQVKVAGSVFVDTDEDAIKEFLFANGPLAVALNAEDSLMSYTSGIIDMDENECNPENLDHGVAIVGYGTEDGQDYWIVRNSWGASWGEKGYFRMARGKGVCGINTHVVHVTLA